MTKEQYQKRQIVSVDEKRLQHIIAGDIPSPAIKPESKSILEKPEITEYNIYFLENKYIKKRRHLSINIDNDLHRILYNFIHLTGCNLPLGIYINNILQNHVDNHKEVMKDIFNNNSGLFK